jgi:hypothetical protein
MDTPDKSEYIALANAAIERIEKLYEQRETIDAEVMKQEQFASAIANFLPDYERSLVIRRIENIQALQRVRDSGLTDSVRIVLGNAEDWLTTTQVRDRLLALGFDFSLYSTNPLASVSTTLRRMKPDDVEMKTNQDGITIYRWKDNRTAKKLAAMQQALANRRGGPPPLPGK